MLNFEDGAAVTGLFQAHSFEDRVLKTAPVHIRKMPVYAQALYFYGADVGADACVGEHSVVMKYERLTEGRYYLGCQTRPVRPEETSSGFESRPEGAIALVKPCTRSS